MHIIIATNVWQLLSLQVWFTCMYLAGLVGHMGDQGAFRSTGVYPLGFRETGRNPN